MKMMILTIILGVCLLGSLAWGYTNYMEVGELKFTEIQLQRIITDQGRKIDQQETQLRQAALAIDDLISERKMFRDKYDLLLENYNQLEEQYSRVQSISGNWETAYNDLLADYNQLQEQMNNASYLQYLLQLLL